MQSCMTSLLLTFVNSKQQTKQIISSSQHHHATQFPHVCMCTNPPPCHYLFGVWLKGSVLCFGAQPVPPKGVVLCFQPLCCHKRPDFSTVYLGAGSKWLKGRCRWFETKMKLCCTAGLHSAALRVIMSLFCTCQEIELSKRQEEEVLSWEALMKDRYLVSLQQEQNGSAERRIQETVQKYYRSHTNTTQHSCLATLCTAQMDRFNKVAKNNAMSWTTVQGVSSKVHTKWRQMMLSNRR